MARLTPEQWDRVKSDWCTGAYSLVELANMHNVSNAAISKKSTAEGWVKLNQETVGRFIDAKAEIAIEVNETAKVNKVNPVNLQDSLDRVTARKMRGEDIGMNLLEAVNDTIPLCEKPSDIKELATAFKSVYEPMFKTNPDTAIQVNNNQDQPKTIRILRAGTENVVS
jgi:hypothetical protein